MDKELERYYTVAAQAAGHPVLIFSGDAITWQGNAPDAAAQSAIMDGAVVLQRKVLVSTACRDRIIAVASEDDQSNMGLKAGRIRGKTVSSRSADEAAILTGVDAAPDWVDAMRATYRALYQDPTAGYLADANWPSCPQEVLDMLELI